MPTASAQQNNGHFDALGAHEDRIGRLEDAILALVKNTTELNGVMKGLDSRLESLADSMQTGFEKVGGQLSDASEQLVEKEKRIGDLEGKKADEAKVRAHWVEVGQKVAIYVATGVLGALGGWLGKIWMTP